MSRRDFIDGVEKTVHLCTNGTYHMYAYSTYYLVNFITETSACVLIPFCEFYFLIHFHQKGHQDFK